MQLRIFFLCLLSASTLACGSDSGGGHPTPGSGGTGGSASGGTGGSSGSSGAGGSSANGGGADAHFALGSSYEVAVAPQSCSLIFHGTGETFTCTWGNPAEENKAEEDSASQAWLIMIGAIEQWSSPTPGCQVHGWIEPDQVTGGFLTLPGESTPTTFGL